MSKLCIGVMLVLSATAFGQTTVTYKYSNKIFPNPERGLFTPFPTPEDGFMTHPIASSNEDSLAISDLKAIRAKGQTLIGLEFHLDHFRHRKLSEDELGIISNDFRLVREAGLKCVLRFAYNYGIGGPDAPLKIILEHISQLKPIFRANYDVICVMQAGFIGAWGEWHSSTNGLDDATDRRKVVFAELKALPKSRMVQVRTPHYARGIFCRKTPLSRSEAFDGSNFSRVGQHDQCFLASWNDFGTYVDTARGTEYISETCRYTPFGGEACHLSPFCECGNAIYQMERLHWSYMSSTWNPAVLNYWKTKGCMNEIERRIGYRFELLRGTYSDSLKPGEAFHFSISLTNVGFAALFNPRDVEIILRNDSDDDRYVASLPVDPRFWQPGDTVDLAGQIGIPSNLPPGRYSLYLNLPDPAPRLRFRPDYSIRIANKDVWQYATGYNNLNATVAIVASHAGGVYKGKLMFRKLPVNSPLSR